MSRPRPFCQIIPDDVLRKIEENAPTVAQRNAARRSLAISQNLRARRAQPAVEPQEGEQREVYDSKNTPNKGERARAEDEPETDDVGIDTLYDDAGRWYHALLGFGRQSYDGKNAMLMTVAHYEWQFDNAYWDGTGIWIGDGFFFRPFYLSPVVTYHEWTHGLTEHTLGLVYLRQAGALNEFLSDAWAAALEQRKRGLTAAEGDWLIGRELFGPGLNGRALRDMLHPGTAYDDPLIGEDPQKEHMDEYYPGSQDNYGVHINSGIPNKAFALAAQRAGGMTDETILPVLWAVMRDRMVGPQASFQEFANAMATASPTGVIQEAVTYGWGQVGITVGTTPVPVPVPEPAPESPCELSDADLVALARNPAIIEAARTMMAVPQVRRFVAGAWARARHA